MFPIFSQLKWALHTGSIQEGAVFAVLQQISVVILKAMVVEITIRYFDFGNTTARTHNY